MELHLLEVLDKKQLKEFIYLPNSIYAGYPNWVPPLYSDEWNFHDPGYNAALSYSDVIRLILYRDRRPVGRIMGIINRKYNELHNEKRARFFNLDCYNDPELATALINKIEAWAKHHGMRELIGPYGFSDKDPQGLQIEGFNHLPVIATPTNPPYLRELVERLGFVKNIDCVSYRLPVLTTLPAAFTKVVDRMQRSSLFRLIEFRNKRQLKPYIVPVFRLINETYAPLFGFVPMSEEEIHKFAAQYLPVLDPAFVKIVATGQDVAAFIVAMPDMSPGMQRARGKLFPFGFIHILLAMKRTSQLNLLLGAVSTRYRGKGLTVWLAHVLFETAQRRGLKFMDSHLVLETNIPMRTECERIGGKIYKRYRVYEKRLV